jgi:FKBP-type peptidyl-prolyl cis-trans isomerase FklB
VVTAIQCLAFDHGRLLDRQKHLPAFGPIALGRYARQFVDCGADVVGIDHRRPKKRFLKPVGRGYGHPHRSLVTFGTPSSNVDLRGPREECDNHKMTKITDRALTFALASTLLSGIVWAQQSSTPSTNTNPQSSTTATPKKPSTTGTTAAKKTATPLVLNTQKDKASYAIGMNIGKGLKENLTKDAVDINQEILLRGMKDALAGAKPALTDEETKAVLTALQNDVRKHAEELHQAEAAKNAKTGQDFLEANKAKPGVVTLPSGLQYKVISEGTGPKPTPSDVVVCNYKGTLVDGTEFDNSYKRGKPATFPVGQVIKGWTEALQLMPVGSKWELVIPPSLGYGEKGAGPIGPDQTLLFEVELMSIQPKTAGPGVTTPGPKTQPEGQPQSQPQNQR